MKPDTLRQSEGFDEVQRSLSIKQIAVPRNSINSERRVKTISEFTNRQKKNSQVDYLLCTQFCDKREILLKDFEFKMSKKQITKQLKKIEKIRDHVAHANNYAMTLDEAKELKKQ